MTQQPFESLGGILARVSVRSNEASELDFSEANPEAGCQQCGGLGWVIRASTRATPEALTPARCVCWVKPMDLIRKHSNIGELSEKNLRNMVNDSSDPLFVAACQMCADYADDPVGWLCIVGPMPSQKQHLAAGVANRCVDAGRSTLFVDALDVADAYWHSVRSTMEQSRNEYSSVSLYEQARNVPVLVLDGLPSNVGEEKHLEGLQRVLDHRHGSALPTLMVMQGHRPEWSAHLRGLIDDEGFPVRVVSSGAPRSAEGSVPYMLLQTMTWDGYDPSYGGYLPAGQAVQNEDSVSNLRAWCTALPATPQVIAIVMCGVGEGKTHLAVCAAKERMLMGDNVHYASAPDLLDRFKATIGNNNSNESDILKEIDSADFLVLEDIGAERSTQYAEEKLFRIINNRYERRMPTLITIVSDYWAELEKTKARIHSRLQDQNLCQHILVGGTDYRRVRSES